VCDARSTAVNHEGIYYAYSVIFINILLWARNYYRAGKPMACGMISLAHGMHCCPSFFYVFCPTSISILWSIWMYTHTHIKLCRDCMWITFATK